MQQPVTINPADATTKASEPPSAPSGADCTVIAGASGKRRSKTSKSGEHRAKKIKSSGAARDARTKEAETSSSIQPSVEVDKVK